MSARRRANQLLCLYVAICAAGLTWPLFPLLADRIRPFLLGVPFAIAWNLLWVVLTFLALLLYHVTEQGRGSP